MPTPPLFALVQALPPLDIANGNVPYDQHLDRAPHWHRTRDLHPLPVLDPDVGVELRRSHIEVVRPA